MRGWNCFYAEFAILLPCVVVQLNIKFKCNTECGGDTEPLHGKGLKAI